MDILKDLEFRGLISQITDEEGLGKHLNSQSVTLYCGFDPTADSLHIGSLLPILILRRFQLAGHRPVALVGGGTGLIGDPSGKKSERQMNTEDIVQEWSEKLRNQLSRFMDFEGANRAIMANNYDWLGELNVISFLRDVGKSFGLNYMLAKESVSARLDAGISFTEFSYMILQSYDFVKLYETENCTLQIGGSDQWGNITAGLELIRKTKDEKAKAYGLTMPLVTKSDGTKFGKTEDGTIWLDADKTTPYEFYQFWVNTDDRDVVRFIKYFTFLTEDEIAVLETEVQTQPEKRVAQLRLAEEVTTLVHGEVALKQAQKITKALFSGDLQDLTGTEIKQGFKDVPSYECKEDEIGLIDLLVHANIAPSKRQAREDVKNGAIYLNGERTQEMDRVVTVSDRIDGEFTIIRRGKKKYFLIKY